MKKPSPLNIKKFFAALGLIDKNGLEQGKYSADQIANHEHSFVTIREISPFYVDGTLLCTIPEAIETIRKSTGLECEKIKDYCSTTWRFKLPECGYISIENYQDKAKNIILDHGI